MYRYVLKRLLLIIPILLGVAFVVFTIMDFTPGSPALIMLGQGATDEAIAQLNHQLGFDRPFFVRFFNYIEKLVLHFDFGNSYSTKQPVAHEILARFPHTLKLALASIVFSSVLGLSLGILSAVKQYTAIDTTLTVLAMAFAAVPGFWLGMMLILLFAVKLGWLPANGVTTWRNFILPMIALSMQQAAVDMRLTRTTMLETIRQDYVRTARAKGAPEKTVIWKHALKNALLPVVTNMGTSFGHLLGGAAVAETVFVIPGLGTYIVNGIRMKDIPVVMASITMFAAMFCIIILIVDLLYAFIDPRIKAKYTRSR